MDGGCIASSQSLSHLCLGSSVARWQCYASHEVVRQGRDKAVDEHGICQYAIRPLLLLEHPLTQWEDE